MNMKMQIIITALAVLVLVMVPAGAAEGTDYTKVFIIPLSVSDTGAVAGEVSLEYGYSPTLGLQSGPFRGELADAKGTALTSFAIWDPRVSFGDSLVKRADGTVSKVSGVLEKKEEADVTLVVPFFPASGSFNLYNGNGTRVASIDLTPAIRRFCAVNPKDPDCTGTGFPPLLPALAGVFVFLAAAGAGWYFLKMKKGGSP